MVINFNENFNGNLIADVFPILRPANENYKTGEEVIIHYKNEYAGCADIVEGFDITWSKINDSLSLLISGKDSLWFKGQLKSVYGFSLERNVPPEFPVFWGLAKWKERHMPVQVKMFNAFYQKALELQTTIEVDEMTQETLFSISE